MGAFYFKEKGRDGSLTSNFPQITSIGFATRPPGNPLAGFFLTQPAQFYEQSQVARAEAISYAFYSAGTLKLSDSFSLAAGIRYNNDERRIVLNPFYTTLAIPLGGGAFLSQPCFFNGLGTYMPV